MKEIVYILGVFLVLSSACRTPYDPEISPREIGVLVVEGYLDTEGIRSELRISRTVPLGESNAFLPELGARVYLYASTGQSYPLQEADSGVYNFEYNVPEVGEYRLEIELRNGERYESELLRPILTPDILDAGFVRDSQGVEVFVTTQGNENADNFLWDFEETWIFRPATQVSYIYDTLRKEVRDRTPEENIYTCYKSVPNPGILLETSSRFQEQVVFRQTITEIPTGDERIQARYSILISQKAIPPDAVKFWETLKKNTEDIGSIFSPLPSRLTGNMRALDKDAPVVGQVNLGVVKQRRVYIDRAEVFPWDYRNELFFGCHIGEDPILVGTASFDFQFGNGSMLPARPLMLMTSIVGYYPIERRCGDCTLYASRTRPDFWTD